MIGLVAKLSIKPGQEKQVADACKQMVKEVNEKETGCLFYEAFNPRGSSSEIWFLEKYTSPEALEEHRQTEHYLEFREKIKDYLADAPEVTLLDQLK